MYCIFDIYKHLHYVFLTPGGFFSTSVNWRRGPWIWIWFLDPSPWLHDSRSEESLPLRADRWYRAPPEQEIDGQDCSRIRWWRWPSAPLLQKPYAAALCLLKSLERGNTSQNLYPEYGPWLKALTKSSLQNWSAEWAKKTSVYAKYAKWPKYAKIQHNNSEWDKKNRSGLISRARRLTKTS